MGGTQRKWEVGEVRLEMGMRTMQGSGSGEGAHKGEVGNEEKEGITAIESSWRNQKEVEL